MQAVPSPIRPSADGRSSTPTLGALLLLCSLVVSGASTDRLKTFVEQTRSASAYFSQTVVDHGGKKIQQASGNLQFARAGKFRWTYNTPYEQLIVGDGAKLWIYDKDLNQVTRASSTTRSARALRRSSQATTPSRRTST
jgi:chaperone LolA